MRPDPLIRVQLRRSREKWVSNAWVLPKELLDQHRSVGPSHVPQDQGSTAKVPEEVAEERHDSGTLDRILGHRVNSFPLDVTALIAENFGQRP